MKQTTFVVQRTIYIATLPLLIAASLIAAFFIATQPSSAADEPLITTWKTDAQYSGSKFLYFTINPIYHGNVSYKVDWGDGVVQSGISGDVGYAYANPGVYTVKISGDFPGFYFKNPNNTPILLNSVDQWGDIVWQDADFAFAGASRMQVLATDTPNLSQVSSMEGMFKGAFQLDSPININNWDVSNIEDFTSVFENAQNFNQPLNDWNTSQAQTMDRMFYNAKQFNQDISNWNVANVRSMQSIFARAEEFDVALGDWSLASVVNMDGMFDESGLDWLTYDATLDGWAEQTLQNNVVLGAEGLTYCGAALSRQNLIDELGWRIDGDSVNSDLCAPDGLVLAETTLASRDIPEDKATNGAEVGTLVVSDEDTSQDVYTYDLSCDVQGDDVMFFALQSNTLFLQNDLDFENPLDDDGDNIYEVCVRVTDRTGNSYEQVFSVTITDVNDDQQDDDGQVLGAVDEPSDDNTNEVADVTPQVLGESDEGDVLAETGNPALIALIIGGLVVGGATALTILSRHRFVYNVNSR